MHTKELSRAEAAARVAELGLPPVRGGDGSTATMSDKEIGEKIDALQATAGDLLTRVANASSEEDVKAVKTEIEDVKGALGSLVEEREERLRKAELDGMKAVVTDLDSAVKELKESSRVPQAGFGFAGGVPVDEKSIYGKGEFSLFGDIARARRGDRKALERLDSAYDGKAMTEGSDAAGGFLVQPEHIPGVLELRFRQPVITNIVPRLRVNADTVDFVAQSSGLTAGWVAELAEKPQADLSFATLSASVFTAAGLAVVSNQLLSDSQASPYYDGVDQYILRDLVKRLNIVVATAIINGSGTGQPLGILNTAGVNPVTYTDPTPTVSELLPYVVQAIQAVQEGNLSDPTHIVMRPSTWNKIVADPGTNPGTFTLGTDYISRARTASDPLPARSLFGIPVLLEPNIPNTLGGGTETRIIVGDFSEALLLEREDYRVDTSEHVYFTSNQTVFRGEQRLGFTAARYPKAFSVIGGTGLAGF